MSNRSTKFRNALLGASAIVSAAALATSAVAADAGQVTFDMPAQPLTTALKAFGAAADQQLIFSERLVEGRSAPALRGEYSPDQALDMLLAGSGLTAERTPGGVVTIRSATQDPQGGSAAGAGAEVEALIVTAQKREEDIQDVPIAISAFTQEDLTRSQVAGGPDLMTQVPNMTFTKTNFTGYSVQIRGIGTQAISATTDPAVAVAFNNTPFIRNRFFEQEFYDLERVEVLRGPQGTLYGRNATAGVVNLLSAKPRFRDDARLSLDVGNFDSRRLEGMVNIPLAEDKVALRVAGAWTKREGYSRNDLTGNPIDGRDLWSTRVSLRVAPTDAVDVNLIWEHFEEDDDRLRSGKQLCHKDVVTEIGGIPTGGYYATLAKSGTSALWGGVQATFSQGCERGSLYSPEAFQTPVGLSVPYYAALAGIGLPVGLDDPYASATQSSDLRAIESIMDPEYRAMTDITELQVSFDITDGLTLASETSYSTDSLFSQQDFNRFNTASGAWANDSRMRSGILRDGPNGPIFCDPQLGCSDRLVAVDVSTAESEQFSQEFRLSSDWDGPFNFSLGANYLKYQTEDKYYVFINSLTLIAAGGSTWLSANNPAFPNDHGPYISGVTDNSSCLNSGLFPGDPDQVYSVLGCVYIDPNSIGSLNDMGHNYFLSRNPYELNSYAIFGEGYYQLTDTLKVTGGLRWSVDQKEAPRIPSWTLAIQSVGYPVAEVIKQEWREPTGHLVLDWKPDLSFTDDTMVYASFAHGYKAGGANPPGFVRTYYSDAGVTLAASNASATRPRTFEPEFIDAFEIGSKNTLLDGKLTANVAAFYYDYQGYQVSEIVDRSAFNRNFDATVWGLEIETDWWARENLRLGFKGGYQKTRIADGEQAIDLMDRTAGRTDWVVVRPFPTYASSCILPTYVFLDSSVAGFGDQPGGLRNVGNTGGGGVGGCELAYLRGVDPQTEQAYVANPTGGDISPGYIGFNPLDASQGHNNGEGFFKPLGGNELPNAPNFTATVTADYIVPLSDNWSMTLHTDLRWQSESWWRIFNDHEYNRLDEYFTMNLAAILKSEDGWNVMAYIKNVTDETAITGAFLNSDDTALTTNVFLTEPRLFGVRVTRDWEGGTFLGELASGEPRDANKPYPFTLTLGGQAQRWDAPNAVLRPGFAGAFTGPLDVIAGPQSEDIGWGEGREARLGWRPEGAPWEISLSYRDGKAGDEMRAQGEQYTDPVNACAGAGGLLGLVCGLALADPDNPAYYQYAPLISLSMPNHATATITDGESHHFIDLSVGASLPEGPFSRSALTLALRYAAFESTTDMVFHGVPDWQIPENINYSQFNFNNSGNFATHTVYDADFRADREFDGAGLVLSWDASSRLLDGDFGRLDIDWSVSGGAIFGDRTTSIAWTETQNAFRRGGDHLTGATTNVPAPYSTVERAEAVHRVTSVTVPTLGGSLGVSYEVDRARFSAGYRWERYFDAIDGGYTESREYDRTIHGPYFKIAVGFGG